MLPNPSVSEATGEWIELFNNSNQVIQLDGWRVRDLVGSMTEHLLTGVIGAGEHLVLARELTKISLNNDQDQLELLDPSGLVIDQSPIYLNAQDDQSWCRVSTGWSWCQPSPAETNIALVSSSPSPSPSPSISPSPTPFSSPSPSPASSGAPSLKEIVRVSEISACGPEQEWVEIEFLSQTHVSGLWIEDESGGRRLLSDGSYLGFVVFSWSSSYLNNSGDIVRLIHQGSVLDERSFSDCTSGTSFARRPDGTWSQTSIPTPAKQNAFPADDATVIVVSSMNQSQPEALQNEIQMELESAQMIESFLDQSVDELSPAVAPSLSWASLNPKQRAESNPRSQLRDELGNIWTVQLEKDRVSTTSLSWLLFWSSLTVINSSVGSLVSILQDWLE